MPTANNLIAEKRPNLPVIFAAILIGTLLYCSSAYVFCLFATFFTVLIIYRNVDLKDRSFMLNVMLLAVILRLIALIFIQHYCFRIDTFDIYGDADMNIEVGLQIKEFLETGDKRLYVPFSALFEIYNMHGKTFFNGIFFSSFGSSIFSVKYVNILCLLVSAWLVYDFSRTIYSGLAGKISAGIFLFWPTLFLWSVTDLKESHFILAIVSMLYFLNKLKEAKQVKGRIVFLILLFISSSYVILLRQSLFVPLLLLFFVLTGMYFAFSRYWKIRHKVEVRFIFIISIFTGVLLLIYSRPKIAYFARAAYDQIIGLHYGFLTCGGWNYNLLGNNDSYYSASFLIKYFSGAWFHFLLEPVPWHSFSIKLLAIYPMMLIWYAMLFLSVAGIIKISRLGRIKAIAPALIFLFLYITIVGMSVANIGTVVRFRDTIMPIVAMLAGCGITLPQEAAKALSRFA